MISGNTHKLSQALPTHTHTHKLTPLTFCSALARISSRTDHPHRRTTIAISPDRNCADRRRSRSRSRRSASIAISRSTLCAIVIAPIGVDRDHRNQRDCDRDLAENTICPSGFSHREIDLSFWVLFEFLGMNDIMCLFGS